MALYAISDLHLSLGTDKPMDVFGSCWENYEQRLMDNWKGIVKEQDIVILNGDNSWAMYIENAVQDFAFINSLPGKKILSKGNHDYWWTTMNKQKVFCENNGFDTISFLHNNHFLYNDAAVCGTRGWQLTKSDEEDKKIHARELSRLEASVNSAVKANAKEIIVALHYPPDEFFKQILKKYKVAYCTYGHLHSYAHRNIVNNTIEGIKYQLVSCDYLNFVPYKIMD